MGGNKKQRTKGNVKPSNSQRTAELLSASGVTGFIGFSGLSTNLPGYVPPSGQQLSEDVESTVDGDFRMVMRKMTKRDTVTKIKALQEFGQLCQEKDSDLVKGALPFWPRLFNKLALDNDRRLREATHVANEQLLIKIKKSIAPFLKSMMGVWLVSLCDPYAPAASAARNALNSAVPATKQADAFDFCKEDIFRYFQDILFFQTAQTLSDDKGVSTTEKEEKYLRLVAGCLKALKLFLVAVEVCDTSKERICELLNEMLKEEKFWKFTKHKEPQVRSAWYAAVPCICQFLKESVGQYASKICPLTLGRLAEGDPLVAPVIWDASLCVLVSINDCWEHVNASKAFLPQLWNFLKEGGKGNASTVYPSLLPLLSKIPMSVVGNKITFYHSFFSYLRQGLCHEKVQSSSMEKNAVISAFVECLKYVQVKHAGTTDMDISITEDLLIQQLLPLLKTSITSSHEVSPKLGGLLLYLESQLQHEEASVTTNKFLNIFWQQFIEFCKAIIIDANSETRNTMLVSLSSFFHNLYSPPVRAVRPKVKFEAQFSEENTFSDSFVEQREWLSDSPFFVGTQDLCCAVLNELRTKPSAPFGNLLLKMCRAMCSKQFFSGLLTSLGERKSVSNDEAPVIFYKALLLPLLLQKSDDKEYVTSLIDLAFVVCSCTTQDYAFDILNELCKIKDITILEEVMSKAAQCRQGFSREWLKSDQVGEIILEIAQRLADVNSPEPQDQSSANSSWRILNLCLASFKQFEPVIRTEYLRQLLDIFHASVQSLLPGCRERLLDVTQVVEFVCDLALNLFDSCVDCWCIPAVEKLLLTLFHLSCHSGDAAVPAKVKVEETWRSGTKKLVSLRGGILNEDGFLYLASKKIHDMVLTHIHVEDRPDVVESLTVKFLTSVFEALPESQEAESCLLTSATICSLLHLIFPFEDEWANLELSTNFSDIFLQSLRGKIILFPFEEDAFRKIDGDRSFAFVQVATVVLKLLKKFVGEGKDDFVIDDPVAVEFISKHLLYVAWSATFTKNAEMNVSTVMVNDMLSVFQFFKWDEIKSFLNLLASRALEKGFMWSLCLADMVMCLKERFPQVKSWCKNFVQRLQFENQVPGFHSLQCLSSQLDSKNSKELGSKVICHLVSVQDVLSTDAFGFLGLLSCCQFTDEVLTVLEFLKGICDTKSELFLSERLLTDDNETAIDFCTSTATFLKVIVNKKADALTHSQWDMILCSLTGWLQSFEKSRTFLLKNMKALSLACRVLHLLHATSNYLNSEEASNIFNGDLVTEWKELYLDTINSALFPLFLWISDATTNNATASVRELVKLLALNMKGVSVEDIVKHCGEKAQTSYNTAEAMENVDYSQIILPFYAILTHSLHPVRVISHNICSLLIEKVPHLLDDTQSEDGQDEKMRPPPPFVASMLESTNQVVETILSDLLVGDCCLVQPDTDAFTYTEAYLFTWFHMLKLFSTASSEVRSEYAVYLQQKKYLQSLLVNLFRLMPQNPSLVEKATITPTRGCTSKTMFTEPIDFDVTTAATSYTIQHLACQVYLQALRKLPAMVRQWWNNQDNRTTDIVNKYTTDYISNYICSQEIKCVQVTDTKFENMTVRARPTAREVVARYSVDEITIELVIRLPPNHPLGPVQVETCQRVGVGQTQWRNWLLQLTTFLTYQNGSILDGLSLWKCNVDKRFEGVEECMICFYVLHGSTCQLPKLMCKTCKKKYHSACLYKWFSTSNNSACPLCRNLF